MNCYTLLQYTYLKYLINKIESVQNFLRKVYRVYGIFHILNVFSSINLQSLEYRRMSPDLLLCYQILHGRCDTTIAIFVHRSDDSTNVIVLLMSPNTIF